MTPLQSRVIRLFNSGRMDKPFNKELKGRQFNVRNLIRGIFAIEDMNNFIFRFSRFKTNSHYEIYGSISIIDNEFIFALDSSIRDQGIKNRYTYALLLAIYTEFLYDTAEESVEIYITSDWEAISFSMNLEGLGIQRKIRRIARNILINDGLLKEDLDKGLSERIIANRFQVPIRVIRERLGDF